MRLVGNILVQAGWQVQCAESGDEVLSKLNENTFNLMITDYDMPGVDGIYLTRHSAIIAPDMPVVLMTGNISPDMSNIAKQAGTTKTLFKPFNQEDLLEVVRVVT